MLSLSSKLSLSFTSIRVHLCKVLGNKVLPLVCLIAILTYWTLGLALPTPEKIINVSNCASPVWGSFDVSSCVFTTLLTINVLFFHPSLSLTFSTLDKKTSATYICEAWLFCIPSDIAGRLSGTKTFKDWIFRKFEPNFKLLLRIEFHALGCVHKCTVFMPAAVLQTLQAEYASRHRYDFDTPRQEALLRGGRCAINW